MSLSPEVQAVRVPEFAVDEAFLNRWSPRAFSSRPIPEETLGRVFEAARWALSSYNEQPWRFIVAKSEADRKIFGTFLIPMNREWAQHAPVLIVTLAKKTFSHNGSPNRVSVHDLGAASAFMALAATQNGLYAHGMAGFDVELARASLGVPTDFEVVAMWALGYRGETSTLPPAMQEREAPSPRRPQSEIVLEGRFEPVPPDDSQLK